jgi:hypothetical protein
MGRLGWCVPCGEERRDVEATQMVDGDPLCAMHARIAAAVEAGWAKPTAEVASVSGRSLLPRDACIWGCGNVPHRGRCKGVRASTAAKTVIAKLPEPVSLLEALEAGREKQPVPAMAGVFPKDVWDRMIERPAAAVASVAVAGVQGESDMDVLVCEEIPVSAVPSGRERNIGRLGQLWARLLATPFDVALKVKCRDADHAGSTARHMTLKARRAGVAIVSRKVGNTYFCHRVREEKAAR